MKSLSNEAKILIGVALATIVIIVIGAFSIGGSASPDKAKSATVDQKILVRSDSPKISEPGAKVTLVEFGDFQCPACGAAYPVVSKILQDYKGKINFVFRNFPLDDVHPNARPAAEAAEAAGTQGKFFEMYNELYSNQKTWGEEKNPTPFFQKYAKDIHLDMTKFNKDIQSKANASKIQQDVNDGNAVSINATPTFFLNGQMIVGGLPYDQFKQKIDDALKNK